MSAWDTNRPSGEMAERLCPATTKTDPSWASIGVARAGPASGNFHFVVPKASRAYSVASAPPKKIVPSMEITGVERPISDAVVFNSHLTEPSNPMATRLDLLAVAYSVRLLSMAIPEEMKKLL